MYQDPYQNTDKPINPGEYLTQISSHAPKKPNIFRDQPLIAAGAVAILLLIIIIIISSLSGNSKLTEKLAARLTTTEQTAQSATTNLKSSQLRALNSSLKSYFANTINDITPILASDNVKIKSLDKNILADESNTDLLATLEDARLNAIYDRTYAREMAYQLDTILTLMLQIYNNTSNKDLKTFLDNARKNLEPWQKEFADFNLATS